MTPKSTLKLAATHNSNTKETTDHKKERPKIQPEDLFRPSKISHSILNQQTHLVDDIHNSKPSIDKMERVQNG
jgi:hypothetical protein